jgi:hypothetical protein
LFGLNYVKTQGADFQVSTQTLTLRLPKPQYYPAAAAANQLADSSATLQKSDETVA